MQASLPLWCESYTRTERATPHRIMPHTFSASGGGRLTAVALGCLTALSPSPADAFYLPGVAPKDYMPGERVSLFVNKLTSTKTQLPFEYYMLPFCQPDTLETVAENLGEVLRGDKIMNSNYELKMGVEETCKILCRRELTGGACDGVVLAVRDKKPLRLAHLVREGSARLKHAKGERCHLWEGKEEYQQHEWHGVS